jgi:LmbE family N-acetylglucosaminyl deacetylase
MVRESELLCAANKLGCHSVHFLDFIDPNVGQDNVLFPYTENIEDIVKKLMPLMYQINPTIMITHGSNGEYGHPAHVISHKAAIMAAEMYLNPIYLYTVQAVFPNHPKPKLANQNDPADLILDCSSVLEHKINAALCHRTQHALFVRNSSREAKRKMTVPEVIVSIESLHLALALRTERNDEDPISKLLFPQIKPPSTIVSI